MVVAQVKLFGWALLGVVLSAGIGWTYQWSHVVGWSVDRASVVGYYGEGARFDDEHVL